MPRKRLGRLVPNRETLLPQVRKSGILDDAEPLELTYRDLARTQTVLRHMLMMAIDAVAESDDEADALVVNSEMARHVFALSRVLQSMASGQRADQLIRPGGRRYDHPARREVIGICVEALEVLQRKGGMTKTAASETISDVIKHASKQLGLENWDVSPRTIREDWPAKASGPEGTQTLRFDGFRPSDKEPSARDIVMLLFALISGPMRMLAEHQEFNPPSDK